MREVSYFKIFRMQILMNYILNSSLLIKTGMKPSETCWKCYSMNFLWTQA